ncbi:hypothetical protein CTEST_08340 [Corynebacterium testudinoris]|uniref:Uncharacterized protein n=1 Tax=Corynebacterium testudinoris TaxID=136857 RepID=A0A0G3HAZ3_9CORY|nr:hypothetical protein CTEST_08340 [Corynebacterium testudinoris]
MRSDGEDIGYIYQRIGDFSAGRRTLLKDIADHVGEMARFVTGSGQISERAHGGGHRHSINDIPVLVIELRNTEHNLGLATLTPSRHSETYLGAFKISDAAQFGSGFVRHHGARLRTKAVSRHGFWLQCHPLRSDLGRR